MRDSFIFKQSKDIDYRKNPKGIIEKKDLIRILAEERYRSINDLIETRNTLVKSWEHISSYCQDRNPSFYEEIKENYAKHITDQINLIDTKIAPLKNASLLEKMVKRGHDKKHKNQICKDLSDLLAMLEWVHSKSKPIDKNLRVLDKLPKKLYDILTEKEDRNRSLKDLIKIRNHLILSWNTASMPYEYHKELTYGGRNVDSLNKIFSDTIDVIDTDIARLQNADLVNKLQKNGYIDKKSIKKRIFTYLLTLTQVQDGMLEEYYKFIQSIKDMDAKEGPGEIYERPNIGGDTTKKKKLVITLGGTIACLEFKNKEGKTIRATPKQIAALVEKGEVDSTVAEATLKDKPLVISKYEEKRGLLPENAFEIISPMEVLSENMTTETWKDLIGVFSAINFEDYSGVIVLHGSDTKALTFTMLSEALIMILQGDVPIPVVGVSSHDPLNVPGANGVLNFMAAVDFIDNIGFPGVFATYHDKHTKITKVLLGANMGQCDPITDDYPSTSLDEEGNKISMPLGIIRPDGTFKIKDSGSFERLKQRSEALKEVKGREVNDVLQRLFTELGNKSAKLREQLLDGDPLEKRMQVLRDMISLSPNILVIAPRIGGNYNHYNVEHPELKAVLHLTYHSKTAPMEVEANAANQSFLEFRKRCEQAGVEVYYGPGIGRSEASYASLGPFFESGGKITQSMSAEALYIRLLLAYALFKVEANATPEQIAQNAEDRRAFVDNYALFENEETGPTTEPTSIGSGVGSPSNGAIELT